jgi:acyl-coenzyme A synthetase/AMP-(fatty) acid ligase
MRTFQDFVDLVLSKNSTIETKNGEYLIKDIVDNGFKNKYSGVKISRSNNGIEFLTDFFAAGFGGGALVQDSSYLGNDIGERNIPDKYFMSDTLNEDLTEIFYSYSFGRKDGTPRLIPHNIESLWSAAESLSLVSDRNSNSVFFNGLVNPSVYFLSLVMFPSMITGGKIIDDRKFPDLGEMLTENPILGVGDLFTKYKPTHSIIIPHIIPLVERTRSWKDADLSSIKSFLVGNEICPPGVFDRLKEKGCTPFNFYTTTEILLPLSYYENDTYIKLLPEVEWKIEDGVLNCRGANKNWYSTGDVVEQKDDKIKILGSKSSEIEHNGLKIYPEIYEAIIRSNPKIVDALLRKKADKLILYYYGNVQKREVYDMLSRHYDDDRMPDAIEQVKYVLPRTIYGNPMRSNDFIFEFEI